MSFTLTKRKYGLLNTECSDWRCWATAVSRVGVRVKSVSTRCRWLLEIAVRGAIWSAIALSTNSALAQITPNRTLPNNSTVRLDGSAHIIEGGTRAGGNLFHSFGEFSVRTGETAHFNNAVDIQNIFGRVTGGSVSNIDGILRANGTANLFLINPNGIVFGKNASLNIGGSFVATTANAIQFGNIGFFSAINPEAPSPLLTINPTALLFNQTVASPIQNNSIAQAGADLTGSDTFGLRVPDGKSLLLVGGDISMNGGWLNASGGRVELGGLAGTGTVGLNVDGNNLSSNFPQVVQRADVVLSRSLVDVSRNNGGDIQVSGRQIKLTDGSALNSVGYDGGGGNIQLFGEQVTFTDGSEIEVITFGSKPGGTLSVTALDSVKLIGGSVAGGLFNQTFGVGDAGDIKIDTRQLIVRDGAQVSASTVSAGRGGNVDVKASESVEVISRLADGSSGSDLGSLVKEKGATGNAGNLTINTKHLIVRDGAFISVGTFGAGRGGNLIVNASDTVEMIGRAPDGKVSSQLSIAAQKESTGAAGDLKINTGKLIIRDGAQVSAGTFGAGQGGSLTVNASDSIEVTGFGINKNGQEISSGLFTQANPEAKGAAGDLKINTGKLNVQDDAQVSVSSVGSGNAGSLTVNANSIRLDNGKLAGVTASGTGGNISLQVQDLILMRNGSAIATTAANNGNGGNITIGARNGFIVAIPEENSDILANANQGSGGQIRINATGIYGLENRTKLPPNPKISEINASSQFGREGNVQINTDVVDPSRGLTQLPTNLVDASSQIDNSCSPGSKLRASSFTITGRGGLPPNPRTEPLTSDAVQVDWVTLKPSTRKHKSHTVTKKPTPTPEPIVQATGWTRNSKGEVVLTADVSNVTATSLGQNSPSCYSSRNN